MRRDGGEEFGAKDRKQLADLFQELFHVVAVSFWQSRAAGRAVVEGEAACRLGFLEQTSLKKSDVRLCQVLILAEERDRGHPEVLGLVDLEPIAEHLRLADVCHRVPRLRVRPREDIDARLSHFLAFE